MKSSRSSKKKSRPLKYNPLSLTKPLAAMVAFAIVGAGIIVFSYAASTPTCANASGNSEGAKIASEGLRQYCLWNGGKDAALNNKVIGQNTLMSWYTNGSPHEEWCADFTSYVLKSAGYPFRGATDGWDEKVAANVVNLSGRVRRDPAGHKPQLGDIVYLDGTDYPAGHVEIVVKTNPLTFVYGNSGTYDQTTHNGEMKEGGLPTDIQYYMTPY